MEPQTVQSQPMSSPPQSPPVVTDTPDIPPPKPRISKVSLLISIVVLLMVVIGIGILMNSRSINNQTVIPSPIPIVTQPSPTPVTQSARGQVYAGKYFTVSIPTGWTETSIIPNTSSDLLEQKTYTSPDKQLTLFLQVTNKLLSLDVPSMPNQKPINTTLNNQPAMRTTILAGAGGDQYEAEIVANYNKKGYLLYIAGADTAANRVQIDTLLIQVISTFKFTDQNTTNTSRLSTEGQSCGRNAGPAGDAQCASGLVCKYSTAQEELNSIGTCVRQ